MESTTKDLREFYEKQYFRDLNIAHIPKEDDFVYGQVLGELRPYLKKDLVVLDLGCNNGNLSLYMARKGCNVTGIDYARNAVEAAQHSAEHYGIHNIQFKSMDFLQDWKEPAVFDLVLCSHVIEHVPEDELFLQKISFSLKPGGTLLLFTPTVYSSFIMINKLFTGRSRHDEEVGHLRRYTKKILVERLSSAGFKRIRSVYLDSALRDWFMICIPLRVFNRIWGLPVIRTLFNFLDYVLAKLFFFPAAIGVHAKKET